MNTAKTGDTVKVHYTGRLDDDTVFDTSRGKTPLEFTLGDGNLIKGFEKGLIGMEVGEKKNLVIPPEEAYGQNDEKLTTKVSRAHLPDSVQPAIGMQLQVKQKDGSIFVVWVTGMDEETVTLDANHPLAGKTLNFDVELTDIAG
ncbi:MAG: peptidylprolyl isomerase [Desulfobacterales bacterium]